MLVYRVRAAGACAVKLTIAKRAKELGYDAIHDTVHETEHSAGAVCRYNTHPIYFSR